ncbi:hypothetical protein KDM87_00705 [Undibacterium sp. FT147W]|uniref:SCP2 domain-containing protein n=1 Tax=Undibacterium rivi TaxID=2828729 RepID=A0ABS5GXC5_9BURK|nr:hypothetical protein [Undibacterium rivi]MBR7791100.1 hypothetical protein [Undibacterium rivi]
MTLNAISTEKNYPDLPWISLESVNDVEAWLDLYDRELQQLAGKNPQAGYGVCFTLLHGGEVYLHTNSDGDILLDVTPDAAWVTPVLTAVTQVSPPRGQIWLVPGQVLMQLILGLNSLIATSRLVVQHEYRIVKR